MKAVLATPVAVKELGLLILKLGQQLDPVMKSVAGGRVLVLHAPAGLDSHQPGLVEIPAIAGESALLNDDRLLPLWNALQAENEFFDDENEYKFYMETILIRYISNYLSNEVVEVEELMEIKQLIQRQKIERMMKVHKEMRGLDRYREQPKEYKYHDPYDDWIFRQLADIDSRNNIPDTSPQLDFDETDYEDYLKEKWNRGL